MVVENLRKDGDVDSVKVKVEVRKYFEYICLIYFTLLRVCLFSSGSVVRARCFWLGDRVLVDVGSCHGLGYWIRAVEHQFQVQVKLAVIAFPFCLWILPACLDLCLPILTIWLAIKASICWDVLGSCCLVDGLYSRLPGVGAENLPGGLGRVERGSLVDWKISLPPLGCSLNLLA